MRRLIEIRTVISTILLLLTISCGSGMPNADDVRQWVGSEVVLSDTLSARADGRDTTLTVCDSISSVKILTYYSAEGCTPCKLKELLQWKPLIEEYATDSLVRFIFVLNPANTTEREIEMTLYGMRFAHPVFYDRSGSFESSNPGLPENPVFHTFLLDRDNRVVLVGSPIGNPKMWTLYTSTIAKLIEGGGRLPAGRDQ